MTTSRWCNGKDRRLVSESITLLSISRSLPPSSLAQVPVSRHRSLRHRSRGSAGKRPCRRPGRRRHRVLWAIGTGCGARGVQNIYEEDLRKGEQGEKATKQSIHVAYSLYLPPPLFPPSTTFPLHRLPFSTAPSAPATTS